MTERRSFSEMVPVVRDHRVGPGQGSSVQLEGGGDLVGVRDGHQMVDGPSVTIAKFQSHPVARRVFVHFDRKVLARRQMLETEQIIPMAGPTAVVHGSCWTTSTSHRDLLEMAQVAETRPVVCRNTCCFFLCSSIVRNFSCSW